MYVCMYAQVLFYNIKAEDNFIKELVATTLCNISTNSNAGNIMSAMGRHTHTYIHI